MDRNIIRAYIDSEFNGKEKSLASLRADALLTRGFTDENLIIHILKSEKKVPKRLPSEMYDKMNYMCRRTMDRMCRFELDYDALPDIEILKNVILCLFESAPVLHSEFIDNHVCPYWKVSDYSIDDVLSVIETDNISSEGEKFLLQEISFKNNVQMKIALITDKKRCKMCFLFNHMCLDGGDLKIFLDRMFRGYKEYKENGSVSIFFSGGSRSFKRVYDDFSPEDRKKAKKLFGAVSAKDKHALPFSEKSENDQKMIVKRKISKEIFESARVKAKNFGATANDLVCAAYIRAFYEISACNKSEGIAVSCAVDLRRYIRHIEKTSYTNHTTFMPCTVPSMGETMADTLTSVVESTKKIKQDKFMGLHGLPLLHIGYSTMIYAQAELVVGLFYNNASLSVSNVGRIDGNLFSFDGNAPASIFVGGGVKEKPMSMLNVLSYNGDLSLSISSKGNEKDRKMLEAFLEAIEKNLEAFCN